MRRKEAALLHGTGFLKPTVCYSTWGYLLFKTPNWGGFFFFFNLSPPESVKPELSFSLKIDLMLQFIIGLTLLAEQWSGLVLGSDYQLVLYQFYRLLHDSFF